MKRIKEVLFASITAGMTRQQGGPIQDLGVKGVGFDGDLLTSAFDRNGIAIGLVGGLAVGRQAHRGNVTTVIIKGRQGTKQGLFFLPGRANRQWLAVNTPLVIAHTSLQQQVVEFLIGEEATSGSSTRYCLLVKPTPYVDTF